MAQPIAQVGGVWGNLVATHPGRGSRDGNFLRQVVLACNLAAWPRSSRCARWEVSTSFDRRDGLENPFPLIP